MKWLNSLEQIGFWQDWRTFLQDGKAILAEVRLRDALRQQFDRSLLSGGPWFELELDPDGEFEQRWGLLMTALPSLKLFFGNLNFSEPGFSDTWIEPLWEVWLPLARQLQQWRDRGIQANSKQQPGNPKTLIVGFLGGQGSGKTTLTALLNLLFEVQGLRSVSWSLDDLYLPYADRVALQKRDPRLARRGPPGTHDVSLGLKILEDFQAGATGIQIPRFNKSLRSGVGDRSGFETCGRVDFVLFEGWFVGARPVAPSLFECAPAPIVTQADQDFARDMNRDLYEYLPLWQRLDRLVILNLQDYRWSKQWRKQAEHLMAAQGNLGMSDDEIDEFVEYFWKALHPELFITPLTQAGGWADLVLEIGADHGVDRVYRI